MKELTDTKVKLVICEDSISVLDANFMKVINSFV